MDRMKVTPDDENEITDPAAHTDPAACRVTPVVQLPAPVALAVVDSLASVVRQAHADEAANPTPPGRVRRAQQFEEGDVYLLEAPFEGFFADRYLMDFYDVRERDICSRMHLHTGLRFVRMMTGPDTTIRVSSLTAFVVGPSPTWPGGALRSFSDDTLGCVRHNLVVPPNSWVDMQIPRGVSHQFNADGPNAVIDSVHPEESIETVREGMSGYRMMAQTIFLADERPPASACVD
jgi:hypothetical protein